MRLTGQNNLTPRFFRSSRRAALRTFAAAAVLVVGALAQSGGKRPLTHKDYDGWKSISGETLSNDGRYLAYALFPQEGDGEVVIRDLQTGQEKRESVGAQPPAPETPNPEAPMEDVARRSVRIVFTVDGRYAIANTFPPKAEAEKARKERRPPGEQPRNGLIIFDLASGSTSRIADVTSFQVPEKGGALLVYKKGPRPAPPAAKKNGPGEPGDSEMADQRPGGGQAAAAAAAAGGARREYGSDLVIQPLDKPETAQKVLGDVSEYSISRDGKTLMYTVNSRKEESNGVYVLDTATMGDPATLLAGKGKYAKLTWDREQQKVAFVSDRDDAAAKVPKWKAYLWNRGAAGPPAAIPTEGILPGFVLSDRGVMNFSRDGSRLFLPVLTEKAAERAAAQPAAGAPGGASGAPAAPSAPGEEKVVLDLWHWKDDFVQPMQKVRAPQDRNRTYRAVYHLAEKKTVQISNEELGNVTPTDDGRYAIGTDDRKYRSMVDYDGSYNDLYIVDTATGGRKMILEKQKGGGGGGGFGGFAASPMSPDGKFYAVYRDKHWWSVSIPDGKLTNLTAKLGVPVHNDEDDHPDAPPALGNAGWTRDSKWFLVYDRFDVWAISPDASTARNLTAGKGRAQKIQYRVQVLERPDAEGEERGVDPSKPILMRGESLETRDTGYFRLAATDGKGSLERLIWGPRSYRATQKARNADVVLMTATTFMDPPDLHITNSNFANPKKVTEANPQKAGILWGTGELMDFKNADGKMLKAAVYKPENFDPSKKYPLMVYIYERLSQGVHNHVRPQPGTSINFSYYVSNGYVVMTPDIVYNIGNPGQSALKCVLPAIDALAAKGFIDTKAIGIQGHSWGGYQISYMVTQTNRFRGIRWGSGLPRQFQYEKTQSRIGGTLWTKRDLFIANSPVFFADKVSTPLLILHNDQDDAVPWYQGIELFLALRRNGKEAYLFNYNGELHGLRKRINQKDYTVRMQQFFDHYLKGAPKPEWMEKGIPFLEREEEKKKFTEAAYSDQVQ
jgi:dipeptidyl aminopeptidase/acylaminoacyl peptidase